MMYEIVEPVFGEEMLVLAVESEKGHILPECTGLWWLQV
jgi:hypothetical protein